MESTCRCCGNNLEPRIEMVPTFNGGFVPESVDYEIIGYYDCFMCSVEPIYYESFEDLPW